MRISLLVPFICLSLLSAKAHAKTEKELDLRDGAVIFATGYSLQLGAILTLRANEDLAPLGYIAFMGSGVAMDLVGDSLGHNGHMAWTVAGTLLGTIGAASLGWVVGESMSNSGSTSKTADYLISAALLSLGPLLGTLSYHWSNRPQAHINARLVPMMLESPMRRRVQGLGLSGTF